MVEWLFLAVPQGCLRFVIVVFPDHTHLLFLRARLLINSPGEELCCRGVRALVPLRKAEWSLSGEPKATCNTFLLLSFYLLVFLSYRNLVVVVFFFISY